MAKSIKAACVAVALAMGLLGTTAVWADQLANGEYQFSFRQTGGSIQAGVQDEAVGFFDFNGGVYSNITGTAYGPVVETPGFINDAGVSAPIIADSFGNSIDFFIDSSIGSNTYYGTPIIVANISNPMVKTPSHGYVLTASLVEAFSGSSSPSSGGAPSPEVNTLLGFLVVAGTVAFIKRRHGDKVAAENAVA